jgi:hypothetical protein
MFKELIRRMIAYNEQKLGEALFDNDIDKANLHMEKLRELYLLT